MDNGYYFEISEVGGSLYAQSRLPSRAISNAMLSAATALGETPEQAASAIIENLEKAGNVSELSIYTKRFHVRFRRGYSLTRFPIKKEELEQIVEKVARMRPDIVIKANPISP